jgi:hypothetical protein
MQTEDQVVELFMALSLKLMHEHGVPPEMIVRVALGNAVHLFLEHHKGGARAASAYLRAKADELDALTAPPPPSAVN